jgi:peptidoglycan/LPS O-acetylase OafA/YrhL
VQGFDVLRGPCILAVVHINLRIRVDKTGLGAPLGTAVNRVVFWSGYNGVVFFFVISGLSYYHVVHQEMGPSGEHPPQAAAPDIQGPIRQSKRRLLTHAKNRKGSSLFR